MIETKMQFIFCGCLDSLLRFPLIKWKTKKKEINDKHFSRLPWEISSNIQIIFLQFISRESLVELFWICWWKKNKKKSFGFSFCCGFNSKKCLSAMDNGNADQKSLLPKAYNICYSLSVLSRSVFIVLLGFYWRGNTKKIVFVQHFIWGIEVYTHSTVFITWMSAIELNLNNEFCSKTKWTLNN